MNSRQILNEYKTKYFTKLTNTIKTHTKQRQQNQKEKNTQFQNFKYFTTEEKKVTKTTHIQL